MSMWTRLQPAYAANMWNEALNKRLGTEVVLPSLTLIKNCYAVSFNWLIFSCLPSAVNIYNVNKKLYSLIVQFFFF